MSGRIMVTPSGREHPEGNGCAVWGCTPKGQRRWYLAGPMTGIDQFNFPAFDQGASWLRQQGHIVISPAELDRDQGFHPEDGDTIADADLPEFVADAMRRDVEALLRVDAVALLPGWETSIGVGIELTVARALGLDVYELISLGEGWATIIQRLTPTAQRLRQAQAKAKPMRDFPPRPLPKFGTDPAALRSPAGRLADGEVRVTSETGGQKGSKPQQPAEIPPKFVLALGEHFAKGAAKYPDVAPGRPNWTLGYDWKLSSNSLLRHFLDWLAGQEFDEDGNHNLIAVAWHASTLWTFQTEGIGVDGRPAYYRQEVPA